MPPARYAGAMLGPYCETEAAAPVVRDLGLQLAWRCGARPIRAPSLQRHAGGGRRARQGRDRPLRAPDRGPRARRRRRASRKLEPDLAGRFAAGLFYAQEGARARRVQAMRVPARTRSSAPASRSPSARPGTDRGTTDEMVIDCRGLGARGELADLRGVRGERLIVRSARDRPAPPGAPPASAPFDLRRAVGRRPAHDRRHRHRERRRRARSRCARRWSCSAWPTRCIPPSPRPRSSTMGAGVRPAFADNVPKVVVRGPHHPRQRPLPPRLPAGARAGGAGRGLPRHRRHRQPRVRDRTKRLNHAWLHPAP